MASSTSGFEQQTPGSIFRLRVASVITLACYPAGAVLWGILPREGFGPAALTGLCLIVLSVIGFAVLSRSYFHRLVKGEAGLDERELQIRNRAFKRSYRVFCAMTFFMLTYLYIAAGDAGETVRLWTPDAKGHWNAILWGAFLYALALPSVFLVWTEKPLEADATAAAQ